jgi:hypothetical protein
VAISIVLKRHATADGLHPTAPAFIKGVATADDMMQVTGVWDAPAKVVQVARARGSVGKMPKRSAAQQLGNVAAKARGSRRGTQHVVELFIKDMVTGTSMRVFEFHNLFNVMLNRELETDFAFAPTHGKIVLDANAKNVGNIFHEKAARALEMRKRALVKQIMHTKEEKYVIKTANKEDGTMAKGWKFLEVLGLKRQTWEVCTLPHMCPERKELLEAHNIRAEPHDEDANKKFIAALNKTKCSECVVCPADRAETNNLGKMIIPYILGV